MSKKFVPSLSVSVGSHQFQQLFHISGAEALDNPVECHSQTFRGAGEALLFTHFPYKYALSESEPNAETESRKVNNTENHRQTDYKNE